MIFFVLNIVFAIAVWLFYPETAGRSLEEIDALFMGDNDRVVVIDKRGRLLPGFRRKALMATAAGLDPEMVTPGHARSSSKDESGCQVDHREDSGSNEKE